MITAPESFWKVFKQTNGALSCAEAIAIMNIVNEVKSGNYLELGSHKGKSAMAATLYLKTGLFSLVEPEFSDEDWVIDIQKAIWEAAHSSVVAFDYIADYSTNVINNFKSLSYIFIDSGVHDDLVMEESKMLEDKMIQGGIIAFHDYLNQFTAVERAYKYLISTGKYEEIKINWQEIFDYVKEHNLEDGNNSWHQYPELLHPPNFVGALKRK